MEIKSIEKKDLLLLAERMRLVVRLLDEGDHESAVDQLIDALEWAAGRGAARVMINEEHAVDVEADDDYLQDEESHFGSAEEFHRRILIERLREMVDTFHARVKSGILETWQIQGIEERMAAFDIQAFPVDQRDEPNRLIRSVAESIPAACLVAFDHTIRSLNEKNFTSVTAVHTALEQATRAQSLLARVAPDDVNRNALLRKAREKACWFRAAKKLGEADVADGGGNVKKASRLRGEAAVLLEQDWTLAFPGEAPPAIVVRASG